MGRAIISTVETCRRLSLPLRDYPICAPGFGRFPSNRVSLNSRPTLGPPEPNRSTENGTIQFVPISQYPLLIHLFHDLMTDPKRE